MVDRFSDDRERGYVDNFGQIVEYGSTPVFTTDQTGNAIKTESEASHWRGAGNRWCGGTINGIRSKLGYLSRLGVTTLWLSPILKQTAFDPTMYHGYATQNFLEIEPHFGSQEDFQCLVNEAHQLGLYVILDIVINHAGQVFLYNTPHNSETQPEFNPVGSYPVKGWTDHSGQPVAVNSNQMSTDDTLWPTELQSVDNFNRRGCIGNWEVEDQYLHGDFKLLKDFKLVDDNHPSSALKTLTQVYQYWLAFTDLDGYRLDAVKHMEPLATRYFVDSIHDFAKSIGKNNFYIIGEVAGGQVKAKQSLLDTGLDAALGILDLPSDLENMVKGLTEPKQYFQHVGNLVQHQATSTNSASVNKSDSSPTTGQSDISTSFHSNHSENRWSPDQIVTLYDDHDQIRKNFDKARFAAGDPINSQLAFNAAAALVCTAGIPCLYYGTEQGFDGAGSHDRYIREGMFGGKFGAFRSKGHHFFNENHQIYQNLQKLLKIRQASPALQFGYQQLLKISGNGLNFGYPTKYGERMTTIIPWLRWIDDQFLLCAFSTDCENEQTVWVELPDFIITPQSDWQTIFSSSGNYGENHYELTNKSQVNLINRWQSQDPIGDFNSHRSASSNSQDSIKLKLTLLPASFVILGRR